MLRYMALNTSLVNLDSYTGNGHNYYCYEQAGVFTLIPWDLNEAFGNFKCSCDRRRLRPVLSESLCLLDESIVDGQISGHGR